MNIHKLASKAEKIVTDNSPLILTSLGVAGTITTAVLTGKASFKAAELIHDNTLEKKANTPPGERTFITYKENVQLTWTLYIPAVATGVMTISTIVLANQIGTRRTAAMAAAYTITDRAFTEYKEKVVEKIGENKEREVRDEIAQDRVNRGSGSQEIVVITDTNKVMCHDAYSNQFFMSDMETIRKAENTINQQILHSDYATVSDLYSYIDADGLEPTSISGDMGWNTDKFLEISYSTTMYKDKTPCISIDFATVPVRDPWRFL